MSLLKFETALRAVLVITLAGLFNVHAQTAEIRDNVSTGTAAIPLSSPEPRKEATKNVDLVVNSTGSVLKSESKRSESASVESNSSFDNPRVESQPPNSQGDPSAPTDEWQFQFVPYVWITSITGRAGIGPVIIDTDTSVTSSDVEFNFGFMGTFEARRNKFVLLTDLQYSDLATERSNPGPLFSSTRASFKTFVLDPEVGYRIVDNEKGAFVDVLGGIRYWHLNGTLAFRAGILPAFEVSRSRGWVDGIFGLRGRAALSERWFVTGKADLGGGGSNFTYQLFGGVGVNVGKRYALIAGYRDLSVNYNKDGFLFDMSLHGPVFGFGIRF